MKFLEEKLNLEKGKAKIRENTLYIYSNKVDDLIKNVKETKEANKDNYNELVEVLNKCGIHKIIVEKNNENKTEYENLDDYQFWDIEKDIKNLDFIALNKFVVETEESEIFENYKLRMEKAYALYYLEEYYETYKEYKKISEKALVDKELYIYALSEFNRYYVGLLAERRIYSKDKQLYEKIDREIKKIDLNSILLKEPFNRKELESLSLIYNWNFDNSKVNKLDGIERKVKENAETYYIQYDKEGNGIYQLKDYISKYIKFIRYNMLVVDKFEEVRSVFYKYVDIIFQSYATPEHERSEEETILGMPAKNLTITEIELFDLLIMIQYLNRKELLKIFDRHEIEDIKVPEKDVEEFITIINRCINFMKTKNKYQTRVDFNVIFTILSKIKLSKEQYNEINKLIVEYMEFKGLDFNNYKSINKYIYYQYVKYENYELDTMEKILENTLQDFISSNFIDISQRALIYNIVRFINEEFNDHRYENKKLLKELEGKNDDRKYEILIKLYDILKEEDAKEVLEIIGNKLEENEKFTELQCDLYYEALMDEIIKPAEKFENKLILFIEELKKQKEKEKGGRVFPDTLNEILEKIPNLIMNDKILNKEKFREFFGISNEYDFLVNTEDFPVKKIKLEWLYDYNDKLLKRMSGITKIREHIKEEIKDLIIKNGNIDNKLLKIYAKYFA